MALFKARPASLSSPSLSALPPASTSASAPVAEPCTAFAGARRIATGRLGEVAQAVRTHLDAHPDDRVLVFDDATGRVVEFDVRGTPEEVARRAEAAEATQAGPNARAAAPAAPRGPGRPRLGVVAREVTLLPRHWDWLSRQPGGASVALRKLVEEARKAAGGRDRQRQAQESAYRFMVALAGDLPGFEEATRALFAGDAGRFANEMASWPPDVRTHAVRLASAAFSAPGAGGI